MQFGQILYFEADWGEGGHRVVHWNPISMGNSGAAAFPSPTKPGQTCVAERLGREQIRYDEQTALKVIFGVRNGVNGTSLWSWFSYI